MHDSERTGRAVYSERVLTCPFVKGTDDWWSCQHDSTQCAWHARVWKLTQACIHCILEGYHLLAMTDLKLLSCPTDFNRLQRLQLISCSFQICSTYKGSSTLLCEVTITSTNRSSWITTSKCSRRLLDLRMETYISVYIYIYTTHVYAVYYHIGVHIYTYTN